MPRLPGFRRAPDSESAPPPPPPNARAVRRALPPPGQLRRERRALLQLREGRLRDLGGLMLEMFKRDRFREDIVLEHCAQLVALENRLHELNVLLSHASGRRRVAPGPQCACGAPLLLGARFCANCGRPVT